MPPAVLDEGDAGASAAALSSDGGGGKRVDIVRTTSCSTVLRWHIMSDKAITRVVLTRASWASDASDASFCCSTMTVQNKTEDMRTEIETLCENDKPHLSSQRWAQPP